VATFATGNFVGSLGDLLQTVDPNFSKQTGFTNDAFVAAVSGSITASAGGYTIYQNSGSPINANYEVQCDVTQVDSAASSFQGVVGRAAAAASTFYSFFMLNDRDEARLYKWVAGVQTQLGSSASISLAPNTPRTFKLVMNGDQISGLVDGSTVVGPITDTDIVAAGKSGVLLNQGRVPGGPDELRISNFSASDLGAGGGNIIAPMPYYNVTRISE
jgi:hypothetical protein